MKRKEFVVTSVTAACYGKEAGTFSKERRSEILSDPTAFVQLNLGTYEGKPLSLRAKANQVGFKVAATIEKNLLAGTRIKFHKELEIERAKSITTGEELDSFVIHADLIEEDGKLAFDVVNSGPQLVVPAGWELDDEIVPVSRYQIRKSNAGSQDTGADITKTLGAIAGE